MWRSKINEQSVVRVFHGFSLVEILISLSLGAFLFFVIAKSYASMIYNQQKQQELLKLQQHTHQLLNYFQQHIQHIGYQTQPRSGNNYDLFLVGGKSYKLINSQCFIFFYDLNSDGCIGSIKNKKECKIGDRNNTTDLSKEFFGFSTFDKNLYIFNGNKLCQNNNCHSWAESCVKNSFKNISDKIDYSVDKLVFSWQKIDKLLKIELILRSIKQPKISYEATAYSYIINSEE